MLPRLRRAGTDPFESLGPDLGRMLETWNVAGDEFNASYPVDIREDEGNVYVEAELPGFRKEDVDITFDNGVLTISAERKDEQMEKEGTQHLRERQFRRVRRSFTMPSDIDADNIEGRLEDGVLKLTLHKAESARPRRIQLK